MPFEVLLAGKALDNGWLLTALDARGAIAVIHPRASRQYQRAYHKEACKGRHLMEDCFAGIKEYRGSATRDDRTDSSGAANWSPVAALLAARSILVSTGPGAVPNHPKV